jgi:hypothetical protein
VTAPDPGVLVAGRALQAVFAALALPTSLATAPAPLVVTAIARHSSKLAARIGPRPVLLAGAVVWALSLGTLALTVGSSPHWLTHWLPAGLGTGLAIGLTLPVQSGAAVRELPAARFAIGSAINASFRQLGAVLGISIFVAVLGTPRPAAVLGAYHHVWWVLACTGLASGLVLFLPRLRKPPAVEATSPSAAA